ncbi:MAG: bifunctional acetaldehyde-CoA/alcohol dehydrogenase [Candidatus Ancillula trichonymphae]|jgi:acetaldehyde dehydrogenase/alcohol dehydrogenase|nr:bifunctional acetaldehyde-CoA/alcohol dehydrogenase [Candidatus Ancillula trichonymphae]
MSEVRLEGVGAPKGVDEVNSMVPKALTALTAFAALNQEQVDYIVKKASVAALNQHAPLAKFAVEETGRGRIEDKAVKNIFACEHVTNYLSKQRTVGVISRDPITGVTEIADPVGVIAGITPTTNPTSTAIFKALIALKTRNPIIFAFHPSAQNSSAMAAQIVRDAAVKAGAPENCIQWIETPSLHATNALMSHPDVATILATGGNAMVKAAYSCGKPALGVGAGNVPAYIEKTADLKRAVNDIVVSKNFDYGMICASEQAAIVDNEIWDDFIAEVKKLKVHICNSDEKAKLEEFIFGVRAFSTNCGGRTLNPTVVGKSPQWIAENAGFKVSDDTSVVFAEISLVGESEPLSFEKLSPVLAIIRATDFADAFDKAEAMLENGGLGHSACIHSENKQLIEEYGVRMKAVRILANSPTSLGGVGDIYNAIIPSLTLGCGSYGHNSVSNNVQAVNLINIKRIGRRNNNMQWFKIPARIYFEPNAIQYLRDMREISGRVAIVTDKVMSEIGVVQKVIDQLLAREDGKSIRYKIIDYVEPEPSIDTVRRGANELREFNPDTIIAVGGGSPMDAAKIMWLLFEHPEIDFADLREKFFDIRKRAFRLPNLEKARLVCIPTTSGTGSEVTPFAVITDHETGYKYPIADYTITPHVAIVDPELALTQPVRLITDSGFDALTHCIESCTSTYANDFTDGLALHGIRLIWNNLETAVREGSSNPKAMEKMHNAATIAGMAFANAFLGMCHGIAHTLGALFHTVHGCTSAILLPNVIRYNGSDDVKPTSWPKYDHYTAGERFQDIAKQIGVDYSSPEVAVEAVACAVEDLCARIGLESSFQALGVDEAEFMNSLDRIAMRAYEDQCTPANPRVPLLEDIKDVAVSAYYGVSIAKGHEKRVEWENSASK